jgi:hypothetical protein
MPKEKKASAKVTLSLSGSRALSKATEAMGRVEVWAPLCAEKKATLSAGC